MSFNINALNSNSFSRFKLQDKSNEITDRGLSSVKLSSDLHKPGVLAKTNQDSIASGIINRAVSLPSSLWSATKNVAQNLSDLNNSARIQRVADRQGGIGIIQGARNFSQEVGSFYQYLGKIDFNKLNRDQIVPHLGNIAQSYMQEQAGIQIFSALEQQFPEAFKEISSAYTSNINQPSKGAYGIMPQVGGITTPAAQASKFANIGSKVLGWAGAAYSLYEIFRGKLDPGSAALSGMAAGAYIGSSIAPGVGTLVGAAIGGVGGLISGLFKSGKPADQKERDAVRKQLQNAGILDSEWRLSLANGASFDMGKDGGAKLQSMDGSTRSYKEFDMSNPLTEIVAQVAAPLAQAISGGNQRLSQELTAYLTNAATSNASSIEGALGNLQVIYAKFGVPLERVISSLQ